MIRIALTFDQLAALAPCDLLSRARLFPGPSTPLDARQAIARGASIKDILWVAGKLRLGPQIVAFAIAVAQRVAHLDTTGSAQRCLDATVAYQKGPSPENLVVLKECRNAAAFAYAADAAAHAATSAYVAAHAAYAYVADVAAYAADAADAATSSYDEREVQKVILLDIFAPLELAS